MLEFNSKNIRTWSLLGMGPSTFMIGISDVMQSNPDTYLLTGDLGSPFGFKNLPESVSDRVFNLGIAEQNMMGVAAGMALDGKQVFVTSYAPFVTCRCADQMRHLMGNLKLNIKAIGTMAGFSLAASGSSLTSLSDMGLVRSLPNITVLSPADCTEAIKMVLAVAQMEGPVYMRLCSFHRAPCVYKEDFDYVIGKANVLREGADVAILATGVTIVSEALKAADELEKSTGVKPTVADIHTIRPLDGKYLDRLREEHSLIVTVEEHNIIGGLGSAVAEHFDRCETKPRQIRIGTVNEALPTGDRMFMLEKCGLTAKGIAERIRMELK